MRFGENYKSISSGNKEWPILFKTTILGHRYCGVETKDGKIYVRKAEKSIYNMVKMTKKKFKEFIKC